MKAHTSAWRHLFFWASTRFTQSPVQRAVWLHSATAPHRRYGYRLTLDMCIPYIPILVDWFLPLKGVRPRAMINPSITIDDKKPPWNYQWEYQTSNTANEDFKNYSYYELLWVTTVIENALDWYNNNIACHPNAWYAFYWHDR